jgi:hypothetical protein
MEKDRAIRSATGKRREVMNSIGRLSTLFAGGTLGGLTNGLVVWLFGRFGLAAALGVALAPPFTPPWLYHRLVWGGIWGLAFLLPVLKRRWFVKGLVVSLGPTLVQLLLVFPHQAHKGLFGLDLGLLTPLLVIFYNAVWGWTAALWIHRSRYDV